MTIETGNTYLDEDYAAAHEEVAAGQYVTIAVSDSGIGMAPISWRALWSRSSRRRSGDAAQFILLVFVAYFLWWLMRAMRQLQSIGQVWLDSDSYGRSLVARRRHPFAAL